MLNFFKKYSLLFVVFLTGACVLVIEVVATRILSPYFGNTIFSVSSIIGVILGALSIGYYLGGILSDRYPKENIFYGIIAVSGFGVLIIYLLNIFLLPYLGLKLSIINGPLISSLLLFFLPSILLGTLSPFAIKLKSLNKEQNKVGSIAGGIFFWSTLGSIFGSLFTGFFLIPNFGINKIILGVAVVLGLIGFIPLINFYSKKKGFIRLIYLFILFIFLFFLCFFYNSLSKNKKVLESIDGLYEKITIYDGKYNGRPTRFLEQDRSNSGAMYLDSDDLVYDFTKYYEIYKVFKFDIKKALVIGGGTYSIPKALLKDLPKVEVDVAEIEPGLFDLAKKYFKAPDDQRLKNIIIDGRQFLTKSENKYDFIFSDVYYSLYSIPSHFTTKEFFKVAYDSLNDKGIFAGNFIGSLSRQEPSFIFSEIKTFKSIFPSSYFFATKSQTNFRPQNIVFVGVKNGEEINFDDAQIKQSSDELLKFLSEKIIDLKRFELSPYKELTDNYCPTDYLISKVLRQLNPKKNISIDGNELLSLVNQQLRYGSRYVGSDGHKKEKDFIFREANSYGVIGSSPIFEHISTDGSKMNLQNFFYRFFPDKKHRIIIGTHYDSKKYADLDSKNSKLSVPGANDSASGVAVLLGIMNYLFNNPKEPNIGVDVVFFDGEEGEVELNQKWQPIGANYFVDNIKNYYPDESPREVIVIDMVCDKNLKILKEPSSVENNSSGVEKFWKIGKKIAPNVFSDKKSGRIGDDHTPFIKAGIPSFLVIDFDYPYWHTTEDTVDKCSSKSLEIVANTLLKYIYDFE